MTRGSDGDTPPRRSRRGAAEILEAAAEPHPPSEPDATIAGPYLDKPEGLYHRRLGREGWELDPLTTWSARIVEERIRDDGSSTETVFVIGGRHATGRRLPEIEVPAAQYPLMRWPTQHWGASAIVHAGRAVADHARVAIQMLSSDARRVIVYTHTGWRRIDGAWRYLTAGGALGVGGLDADIRVDLDDGLAHYRLPSPPTGPALVAAVRSSLALPDLTADAVAGWLLIASIYRAPLGEACGLDVSVLIVGPSGAKKTELAALGMAHYGAFDARSLPASWLDTPTAIEASAHATKDALFVIDDYRPAGSSIDVQRLHGRADHVLRAAGNRTGRRRANPDLTARPVRAPRGLILSTGEDTPPGESARARAAILELQRDAVDLDALTEAQSAARSGRYRAAMAGYVAWLAPQIDALRESLPERLRVDREAWRTELGPGHARAPDNAAQLWLGVDMLLRYALDAQAIVEADAAGLRAEARAALGAVMSAQAGISGSEGEADRFLALLRAALLAGRAHLRDGETHREPVMAHTYGWRSTRDQAGTEIWQPAGETIGWVRHPEIWLDPEAALAVVQGLARAQGRPIDLGARTLWSRLADAGHIRTGTDGGGVRTTHQRSVAGRRRRVIVMPLSALSPSDDSPPAAPPVQESAPEYRP